MTRSLILSFVTFTLLLGGMLTPTRPAEAIPVQVAADDAASNDDLTVVRRLMRRGSYDAAANTAARVARGNAAADEITYLHALALHELERHDEALEQLERFQKDFADSRWYRKARFLTALSLSELRRFEQAQQIYETEAQRLLSDDRSERLAHLLIAFADELSIIPDPLDLGAPPPNHGRAAQLYQKALEMKIGRSLRDEVLYKIALSAELQGNHNLAITNLWAYLSEFDPNWFGPVGTPERMQQQDGPRDIEPGASIREARLRLARIQNTSGVFESARVNLEDLEALVLADPEDAPSRALLPDLRWEYVRTWQPGRFQAPQIPLAVAASERLNTLHPEHPGGVFAAWRIATTYQFFNRLDEAADAYLAFHDGSSYSLPDGAAAIEKFGPEGQSPVEYEAKARPQALFVVAQIHMQQRNFEEAITRWTQYINSYPNGANWADAQRMIRDAQVAIAERALTNEEFDRAERLYTTFLAENPLDSRAPRILFTLGQIPFGRAEELRQPLGLSMIGDRPEDGEPAALADARELYRAAIARWSNLISKYPNASESSYAMMRTGLIWETILGDLEQALTSYRAVTGPLQPEASKRIAAMTQKSLQIRTERIFRTNEPARIRVTGRNIDSLTIRRYALDAEAYFRKTHGITGVEHLDIALIEPDSEWTVDVSTARDYMPFDREIIIPMDDDAPGLAIINVSSDTLESTTLVVRSDLQLITRAHQGELLVYAQDMRTSKPAADVPVLVSNGSSILLDDATGNDGTFRTRLDPTASGNELRIFASLDGHVAYAGSAINQWQEKNLSDRAYIYTAQPGYEPGDRVNIRGIVRYARERSHYAPANEKFVVSVIDSQGRVLLEQDVITDRFGSFSCAADLPPSASVGMYAIGLRSADEKNPKSFSGSFAVQQFVLPNAELRLTFDKAVYQRGDIIKGTAIAEYYWGGPVADEDIGIFLPDNSIVNGRTDSDGRFEFTFDTRGVTYQTRLAFRSAMNTMSLSATDVVQVAGPGFNVNVSTVNSTVLSEEPFDVVLKTTSNLRKPVERKLTVDVVRLVPNEISPVITGLPWIERRPVTNTEVVVDTHTITTNEDSGTATLSLTLEVGGNYVIRARGTDDSGEERSGSAAVNVSDDSDETRLRIFAETDTLDVGADSTIDLHARVDGALALLTWESDTIIEHRIVALDAGHNDIDMTVGSSHYPQFHFTAAVLDGQDIHEATHRFAVERELRVTVTPAEDSVEPGDECDVTITAVDQLGNPVEAQFSLALIDAALQSLFADPTMPINTFFELDYLRGRPGEASPFRTGRSNNFQYAPTTTLISQALLDEAERLEYAKRDAAAQEQVMLESIQLGQVLNEVDMNGVFVAEGKAARRFVAPSERAPAAPVGGRRGAGGFGGGGAGEDMAGSSLGLETQSAMRGRFADREARKSAAYFAWQGGSGAADSSGTPRLDIGNAGFWRTDVVTDANGTATLTIPMPERTSRWTLQARGIDVGTLAGQAEATVTTTRDFFVDLQTPGMLFEGDTVRLTGTVQNSTGFHGTVNVSLEIHDGENLLMTSRKQVSIDANSAADVLFDSFKVPFASELRVTARAEAGPTVDALTKAIDIEPWGMIVGDYAGGVSSTDQVLMLELPNDRTYRARDLELTIAADVEEAVLELLRGRGPFRPAQRSIVPGPDLSAANLLAAVSGLRYAEATRQPVIERQLFIDRARALVATLVVQQERDGGWGWMPGSSSEWSTTARVTRALAAARDAGIAVSTSTLTRAADYLRNAYKNSASTDSSARAMILSALSSVNAAEFELANALYRERNRLSPNALAHTALVMAQIDRLQVAGELLDILVQRQQTSNRFGERVIWWEGAEADGSWWTSDEETTAVALLALMRARPGNPNIEPAIRWLLDRDGMRCGTGTAARGLIAQAVGQWFSDAQFADADFTIAIEVNDATLPAIERRAGLEPVTIDIPADAIKPGRNIIRLNIEGRGRFAYAATLRGFTETFKDPQSWRHPSISNRSYYHAPLTFNRRPIGAASTSPVSNLEVGQRTRVQVSVRSSSLKEHLIVEEALPAGTTLVPGSLSGNFSHHEVRDGRIIMYHRRNHGVGSFSYELIGAHTGNYRVMPTIIRDATNPARMRLGELDTLNVLAPDETSSDPYKMNDGERMALGRLTFDMGDYDQALEYLWPLFDRDQKYNEREVSRMILWIHTSPDYYNAARIVSAFEVLSIRYPDLTIPFDRILSVGQAYRDLGEFERAMLVYQATIDSNFFVDSGLSAVLEDLGQLIGAAAYQERLWWEYPDTAAVATSYFALSQRLYEQAGNARAIAANFRSLDDSVEAGSDIQPIVDFDEAQDITRASMIGRAIRLIDAFMTTNSSSPLCDDAAFSLASALLDLQNYDAVIQLSASFGERFVDSEFESSFQYMQALGHFWKRQYDEALGAARVVAEGESADANFAKYILGQIHHAQNQPADAIRWYDDVKTLYPDAREAIEYFSQKIIAMDEVTIVRPGDAVNLELRYRNIDHANLQVYKVDLMKLYLREKNLSQITSINLAGIEPLLVEDITLGGEHDFVDQEYLSTLPISDVGAYLVICRGEELFTSGLVLVTPLRLDVQEEQVSGRVRVNVIDESTSERPVNVHVKAIGTGNQSFVSGETDLRGVFIADNINGAVTVIARDDQARYAFHRGENFLGSGNRQQQRAPQGPGLNKGGSVNYLDNLQQVNDRIQRGNFQLYDQSRRGARQGVQVEDAK